MSLINAITKIDEEPHIPGIGGTMATGLSNLGQKQIKTFFGIFKSCIGNTPTINELYRYV